MKNYLLDVNRVVYQNKICRFADLEAADPIIDPQHTRGVKRGKANCVAKPVSGMLHYIAAGVVERQVAACQMPLVIVV